MTIIAIGLLTVVYSIVLFVAVTVASKNAETKGYERGLALLEEAKAKFDKKKSEKFKEGYDLGKRHAGPPPISRTKLAQIKCIPKYEWEAMETAKREKIREEVKKKLIYQMTKDIMLYEDFDPARCEETISAVTVLESKQWRDSTQEDWAI